LSVLQLKFFASIRERLGTPGLSLDWQPHCTDVEALIRHLDGAVLPGCAKLLGAPNTLVAVNRVLSGRSADLADGDEIAFYPPVTGG
jgi:molybdopterin synthase sulfur carrier subunit